MRALDTALLARSLLWLARTRRWDADRIDRYQQRALSEIFQHAITTVPYYRDLGIRGSDLTLASFPLLTKLQVQQHAESLLSEAFDPQALYTSRSSGSTGHPTSTRYDRNAWILTKHALKLRRVLTDIGRPPYRILIVGEEAAGTRSVRSRPFADAWRLSIHDGIESHIEAIMRFRPTGLYGSPSWLLELVQTARRESIVLPVVRVVWTSSEVLTAGTRDEIAVGFSGMVRDVYGSTEFKEVAVECAHGRRHINFESSYVEILPEEDADAAGAIVITSLANRAMPLIRYRIGDVGRLTAGACPCGRAAPWLDHVEGREVDLIQRTDGRRISPYLLSTIVEAHAAIARYQLFERTPGSIEVRFQLRPGVDAFETAPLAMELDQAVDGALRFSFTRTDSIERTPAGKHRALIRPAASA